MNQYLIGDIHEYLKGYKFAEVIGQMNKYVVWNDSYNVTFYYYQRDKAPSSYLYRYINMNKSISNYRNKTSNRRGNYYPRINVPDNYWFTYTDKESLAEVL